MVHSLRVRLLLALGLAVAVTVGLMALFVTLSTSSDFEEYISQTRTLDQARLADALADEYARAGDWDGAQALIEPLGQVVGNHIIVLDARQIVVADSQNQLFGASLAVPIGSRPMVQQVIPAPNGFVAGYLLVVPLPNPPEVNFLDALNRSLLLAALIAAGTALLLTLVLSRRILRPVEALTRAARKMEIGDLSQRVRVQTKDEIGELGRAFNNMADGLARQEELRRNMVGDVTHELRTPISNLRGYLEALQDGLVQPDPAMLASLHEETMLLSRLVEDLQELALAEARQLRMVRQPVAPAALIAQVAQTFQPLAAEKGLQLYLDLAPELPRVLADPSRIGQVLRNLLNNAMTHTGPGGTITIAATRAAGLVEIAVRDSGCGIAPEHLPHIFDRFFRADPSRARATGGAGLGLAIVKQLVELHGGTVRAESTPGHGAAFIFTLPVYRPRRRPRQQRPAPVVTIPLDSSAPARVVAAKG